MANDKDKLVTICPKCGKNHKPDGKLTAKEQADHHKV